MKNNQIKLSPSKRIAYCSVFLGLSLLFSYIEAILGFNIGVPGVKIGFANLVVLFMIYRFGCFEAFAVNILRIFISGLLFGNLFSLIYALSGGIASFIVMLLLKSSKCFSPVGVSAGGAVAHNIFQLIAAALVLQSTAVFVYSPALIVCGLAFGTINGILCKIILKKVLTNL